MSSNKVMFKRLVSPEDKSVAQAYSEVITSDDSQCKIRQTVTVNVSSSSSSSSCSSICSASSSVANR